MRPLRLVLLAVTLLGFGAGRVAAQTTYDACYVPSVGAIYLIKQAGLPNACLAQNHVAFSWTSGGTVADGSITLAKLAFDPATQAELNTVLAQLAATGTINTSANPVDWTQLKNVPAGFADGVDAGAGGTSDHGGLTGLTDDDHTQYLLANGARTAMDGFAVTGTFGSGALAATGGGARLLWYPRKGAFRAGVAFGTAWDDANIGLHSVALGGTPMARGDFSVALGTAAIAGGVYSTAIGAGTSASADSSTALGTHTTADGIAATAMGSHTIASGGRSTAMGFQTSASGFQSTAMGSSTTAIGNFSTAMGNGASASGNSATAMGLSTVANNSFATAMGNGTLASGQAATAMGLATIASGFQSTAMGFQTTASGVRSTAMGNGTRASGDWATSLGSGTGAPGDASVAMGIETTAWPLASLVIGRYNNNASLGSPTSWVATEPLFVAGNGSGPAARTDAFVIYKDGDVIVSGTLSQASDLRFKEHIEPMQTGLDGVLRLRPIRYQFREGTGHPTDRQIGLGAQDVEQVFPELVHRDSQGRMSVAYTQLAAVLVRAVQEQQTTIAALLQRIEQLERRGVENR